MKKSEKEEIKKEVDAEVKEELDKELKEVSKKIKKKKFKKHLKTTFADFKKFASKGNAMDMAIGVVIGGAFTTIVTAVTNILLNLVAWPAVGGLDSLITVLPAAGSGQAGLLKDGTVIVGQSFSSSQLNEMIQKVFDSGLKSSLDKAESFLLSNYKLYGTTYVYTGAAVINWGAVINAIISFIIIAVVLFLILKTVTGIKKASALAQEKALEEYYKKHPDERPIVEPKVVEKSEKDLLKEMVYILRLENADLIKKDELRKKKEEEKKKKAKASNKKST